MRLSSGKLNFSGCGSSTAFSISLLLPWGALGTRCSRWPRSRMEKNYSPTPGFMESRGKTFPIKLLRCRDFLVTTDPASSGRHSVIDLVFSPRSRLWQYPFWIQEQDMPLIMVIHPGCTFHQSHHTRAL